MQNFSELELGPEKASNINRKLSNPSSRPDWSNNPNNAQVSSKAQAAQILQEHLTNLEKNHKKLREFVIEGLLEIREELLPLLFCSYLKLHHSMRRGDMPMQLIKKWRSDFANVDSYMKDLAELDASHQTQTENEKLTELFVSKSTIVVNQFVFESLFLFLQKNNLQLWDFDFMSAKRISIEMYNEKTKDVSRKKIEETMVNTRDLLSLTEERIRPGIRKDEALFMHLLLGIQEAKMKEGLNPPVEKLTEYLQPFRMEVQEEKTMPLPEKTLRYQVDFAKAFLNRSLKEKTPNQNILHITTKDPFENVTCMEIEALGNILLLGYSSSVIRMVVLNHKFKEKVNSLESLKKQLAESLTSSMPLDSIDSFSFIQENKMQIEKPEKENGVLFGENGEEKDKEDQEDYEMVEFVGHEEAITSLSLQYDEQYFLSSSVDATVRLWCIRSRTCLNIYKGHINTIWRVKFSSRGLLFASGSSDTTARVWSIDNVIPIRTLLGHNSDVHVLEFSSDCKYLTTASHDKSIRVWDVNSGQCIKILYSGNYVVSALRINYNSSLMASGMENGRVILWDLSSDKKLCNFCFDKERSRVNSIDFSVDSQSLVVSSRKRINYYDINTLKNYKEQKKKKEAENGNSMAHLIEKSNGEEKTDEETLETNSIFFEEDDYHVFMVKYNAGNFIFALSRWTD